MHLFKALFRAGLIGSLLALSLSSLSQETTSGDGLTDGPGLFSGDDGAFTLFTDEASPFTDAEEYTNTKGDEFRLFKQWTKIKKEKSDEYKEFLLWLEYKKLVEN